jgi:hypothetical protein
MATMSKEDLLEVFKNMTVLELNDFLKAFEEEFGVTAAAPVAVAAAGGAPAKAQHAIRPSRSSQRTWTVRPSCSTRPAAGSTRKRRCANGSSGSVRASSLYAASLAAHRRQTSAAGSGARETSARSAGASTRATKRGDGAPASARSTTSLPTATVTGPAWPR